MHKAYDPGGDILDPGIYNARNCRVSPCDSFKNGPAVYRTVLKAARGGSLTILANRPYQSRHGSILLETPAVLAGTGFALHMDGEMP